MEVSDVYVRERVKVADEPFLRPARALGYARYLSLLKGVEGEYPVRLAEVDGAQHDRLGPVAAAFHLKAAPFS